MLRVLEHSCCMLIAPTRAPWPCPAAIPEKCELAVSPQHRFQPHGVRAACSLRAVEGDGELDSVCALGGPAAPPVSATLANAWSACLGSDSDACRDTWFKFMSATGCVGCNEEVREIEARTDAFCRGLRGGECEGTAAPCGGELVGDDAPPHECAHAA